MSEELDVDRLARAVRSLLENEDGEVFAVLDADGADDFAADLARKYAGLVPA